MGEKAKGLTRGQQMFLFWGLVAGLFLVVQFRVLERFQDGGGTLLVFTEGQAKGTVLMEWEGPVQPPMLRHLKEAFARYRSDYPHIILSLASNGGRVEYGGRVVDFLRKMKKTHRLTTMVFNDERCLSMCVPIYLQGEQRLAGPRSQWMFHEVLGRNEVTGESETLDTFTRLKDGEEIYAKYFLPAGVNPHWLEKMKQKIRGQDYWLRGVQLFGQGSGIIHRLVRGERPRRKRASH